MKKIAVIGAGISGISLAKMLENDFDITIFEKKDKPGGLIRCEYKNGFLYHKVGGHVFNSKNKAVLNWFWKHFDKNSEFINTKRNAKILLHEKYINYPVENHIYQLNRTLAVRIITEIMELNKTTSLSTGFDELCYRFPDFESFLKGVFGETLYNIYFEPYNRKIWQRSLSLIPLNWLKDKLPMPDFRQIVETNILRLENDKMVHSAFFYPKSGGSQFIIDRLATGLQINYNEEIKEIKKTSQKFTINGKKEFDYVVYTGDIRKLKNIISINNTSISFDKTVELISNNLSNAFCITNATNISWLYLPDEKQAAHRVIYTGNFSRNNNPEGKNISCVIEFAGNKDKEFMRKMISGLPFHAEPVDFHSDYPAYVVHTRKTREIVENLGKQLQAEGFFLLGRFAEWQYYNMDKCIESAMRLKKNILNYL